MIVCVVESLENPAVMSSDIDRKCNHWCADLAPFCMSLHIQQFSNSVWPTQLTSVALGTKSI